MHAHPSTCPSKIPARGFSLVELLVAIAVIGILAGIAIPSVGNINDAGKVAAAQRRAQDIASVFAAGQAGGAPSFLAAQNVREAMDAVGAGDNGADRMASVHYQIEGVHQLMGDDLPVEQRPGYYLQWGDGSMAYEQTGGNFN